MAQQVGVVIADSALDIVVVGLADTAGEHLNQGFTLDGVGHIDGDDFDGLILGQRDKGLDLVHGTPLVAGGNIGAGRATCCYPLRYRLVGLSASR